MKRALQTKSWLFGLACGVTVAIIITVVVTVWEWIENPGGIFHGPAGTNWKFVFDTAISWFLPTFLYISIIAGIGHFLYLKWKKS